MKSFHFVLSSRLAPGSEDEEDLLNDDESESVVILPFGLLIGVLRGVGVTGVLRGVGVTGVLRGEGLGITTFGEGL